MNTISYSKELPVTDSFDVVVCGGGPAGIGASISAAEHGAKVALIERFGFPGGMATAGYVNPMSEFAYNGRRVIGGIPWRFVNELIKAGGALVEEPRCNVSFNPEVYKLVSQRMLQDAGVHLYMNSFLTDCITSRGKIQYAIITNKNGLQAIGGKYFIDATGDADLAHFANAPIQPQTKSMQPGTFCFCLSGVDTTTERMHIIHQRNHRFNHQAGFVREALFALRERGEYVPQFGGPWLCTTLQDGCITVNMTRSPMDSTDSKNYQDAEYRMREDIFRLVELLRENIPEFRNCQLASIATMAGIRESRRIMGLHVLTGEEYVKAKKFPDAVARACHPVDIHLPNGEGQSLVFPEDAGYIPYRCLITRDISNLLVAGRAISADAEAFAAIRVQAPCMETGQAAGIAAALCLENNIAVQNIDINRLVEEVRLAGSFV